MRTRPTLALAASLCLSLGLCACEKSVHDMYEQPRYGPLQGSALFADGRASQPAPPQTLAVDAAASARPAVSAALLERGRDRYGIYCAPCHGADGQGDGMLPRRGFPAPPSYHSERLRNAPDSHFYDVISRGYGVMYSYGDRLSPDDRWAVIAYIRALQLSRNARVDQLPQQDRQALEALP
jgi:mono/diheme cytochrome c family protein